MLLHGKADEGGRSDQDRGAFLARNSDIKVVQISEIDQGREDQDSGIPLCDVCRMAFQSEPRLASLLCGAAKLVEGADASAGIDSFANIGEKWGDK